MSLLRFFVESRRYSVVDRVSYALNYESVREALADAFRIVESLRDGSAWARIRVKREDGGEREIELTCCEYGKGEGPGVNGEFVDCSDEDMRGERGWCVPCPHVPDEREVNEFMELVKEDINVAKDVALLAHSFRSRREGV